MSGVSPTHPGSNMEELKDHMPEMRHTEGSDGIPVEQRIREGEELEAREKRMGIWESMKQHRRALVFSKPSITVSYSLDH